jgi:hypothetical protein
LADGRSIERRTAARTVATPRSNDPRLCRADLRGIFAVHSWIVVKERGAPQYTRYDYTAWGEPIRVDGFAPDGRWFGTVPDTVVSVDGEIAERLIPKIRSVIEKYGFSSYGDYRPWPGPNSNTFVQAALDAVPELKAVLPPTAIGKDYPYRSEWVGFTPSGTGVFATLGGYVGLTIGWVEGVELNFFGGVLGSICAGRRSNFRALVGSAWQRIHSSGIASEGNA